MTNIDRYDSNEMRPMSTKYLLICCIISKCGKVKGQIWSIFLPFFIILKYRPFCEQLMEHFLL